MQALKYHLQPGDIIATRGAGAVGFAIKTFTQSEWAHIAIVRSEPDALGNFATDEAFPMSVKRRSRNVADIDEKVILIIRLWRTPEEQAAICATSEAHLGMTYALGELARIAAEDLGRLAVQPLTLLAAGGLALAGIPEPAAGTAGLATAGWLANRFYDQPHTVICSNHVTRCGLAGRPDLADFLTEPPDRTDPGEAVLAMLRLLQRDAVGSVA